VKRLSLSSWEAAVPNLCSGLIGFSLHLAFAQQGCVTKEKGGNTRVAPHRNLDRHGNGGGVSKDWIWGNPQTEIGNTHTSQDLFGGTSTGRNLSIGNNPGSGRFVSGAFGGMLEHVSPSCFVAAEQENKQDREADCHFGSDDAAATGCLSVEPERLHCFIPHFDCFV